jgi:hypothetical protein
MLIPPNERWAESSGFRAIGLARAHDQNVAINRVLRPVKEAESARNQYVVGSNPITGFNGCSAFQQKAAAIAASRLPAPTDWRHRKRGIGMVA